MKKRYARVKAEALRETIEKMEISDAGGSQMMQNDAKMTTIIRK